jgi:hypothetical protein
MNLRLPILSALSMPEYAALSMFAQKVASWASGSLGLLGLPLVALGVCGVTAFSVAQPTREIGIRVSIGGPVDNLGTGAARDPGGPDGGFAAGMTAATGRCHCFTNISVRTRPIEPLGVSTLSIVANVEAMS